MTLAPSGVFASERVETRLIGTAEPIAVLPDGMSELTYPEPVATSIYFGWPETNDPVPDRGSLRFRFRSVGGIPVRHMVHVIDPEQTGALELKLRHGGEGSERWPNRKYTLPNLTIETVRQLLATPEGFDELADLAGEPEFGHLVDDFFEGKGVVPLQLVQAHRRHFVVGQVGRETARLTLDTGTTFWNMGREPHQRLLYAARSLVLPFNILEIKAGRAFDTEGPEVTSLLGSLFGADSDYTGRARVKRREGQRLVELGAPKLKNGELQQVGEEEARYFREREHKIDTSVDPRELIAGLPNRPDEDLYISDGFTSDWRFRFHSYTDGMVVVEKSKEVDLATSGFQYKRSEPEAGGMSVRQEYTGATLERLFADIGYDPAGQEAAVSAMGVRNRLCRPVVCEQTGNLFVLLADHCTASDGRAVLNQVEIEFIGTLGFGSEQEMPDEAVVVADFERLRSLVTDTLGAVVVSGQTTKQAWLTAPLKQ